MTQRENPAKSGVLSLVAMDGMTWNLIKEEMVGMAEIVSDYQKIKLQIT